MSEVEFEFLLDAVRTAVAPVPGEDSMTAHVTMAHSQNVNTTQRAANDNARVWPLIPFPDGWNAAC